jgi:Domain of unknown function (DUF4389)
VSAVPERPVRLRVSDDLRRDRLTVFFRILLALPHLIWLALWAIGVLAVAIVNWVATLIRGTSPEALHRFQARFLTYATHVGAYLHLIANPYPGFTGEPGYPVDVEIDPPRPQNRWTVLFRGLLAVPALMVEGALGGFATHGRYSAGLIVIVAVLGWFVSLARTQMPRGLRDAGAYALSYSVQLSAYLLLLTDRYPDSDPLTAIPDLPARTDPIRLECRDDLRRSRLTVFFRLLLALPHVIWLALWAVVAVLAAIASWVATLVSGQPPAALQRFLSAFVRYSAHVSAYLYLIANPFPGFTGRPGSYPVDVVTGERETQNRWTVFFRLLLGIPALAISGAYGGLLFVAALLGWFAALFTGRMPQGLRNAGALAIRYSAQTYGYLLLVTGSYPYSGPIEDAPASVPESLQASVPIPT